jgi:hypothetical protein
MNRLGLMVDAATALLASLFILGLAFLVTCAVVWVARVERKGRRHG